MGRIQIINDTIRRFGYKNYLEIGVYRGKLFLRVKCKMKSGVDPEFKISLLDKAKFLLHNSSNFRNRYFELTSDRYFETQDTNLKNNPIDLCFIDGLHTYEQSLKDALNALKYVKLNGYIMMHDCSPPSKASAAELHLYESGEAEKLPGWKGEWCGDVWKTIIFLRKVFPQLRIGVLDSDYGIGVIHKTENVNTSLELYDKIFKEVKEMTYEEIDANRTSLINLMPLSMYSTFVK